MWRWVQIIGAVALMIGVVWLCAWAVISSYKAQALCEAEGYARGEAMFPSGVFCSEGKLIREHTGER